MAQPFFPRVKGWLDNHVRAVEEAHRKPRRAPARTSQVTRFPQRPVSARPREHRATRPSGGTTAAGGDSDREPPLTWLQLARLAVSRERRARLGPEWRECSGCLREQEPEEFRPGRRLCRSCESEARLARFEAAV
jgi:hypothetical protein